MEDKKSSTPTARQTWNKKRSLELEPQPLAKSRRQNYTKIQADKQMEQKESTKSEMNDSPTSPEPTIQSSPSSSPEWEQSLYSPVFVNQRFSKQPLTNSSNPPSHKNPVDSYPPSPENSPTHITPSVSNTINNKRSALKRSSEDVEEEPSLDFFIDTLHGSLDPFNEPESNNNNNVNSNKPSSESHSNNSNNKAYDEDTEEDESSVRIEPQKASAREENRAQPLLFNAFRLTPPKKVTAPSRQVIDLRSPSPVSKQQRDHSNRFAAISDEPAEFSIAVEDDDVDNVEWPEEEEEMNRSNRKHEDVPANQQRSRLRQSKLSRPPRTETQTEPTNKKEKSNNNTNTPQPYQSTRWRDDLPQPPANTRPYSSFRDLLPYAELNRTTRQNAPPSEPSPYEPQPSSLSATSEPTFNTDEELARHLQLMEQYGPNADRLIAQQQAARRHGTSLGMTGSRQPAPPRPQPSPDEEIARRMQEMEYNRAFGGAPSIPARGFDPMGIMQNVFRRRFGPSHPPSISNAPLQMRLAMTNRDFTDADYEMLLQLDEHVEKKGASKSTIRSLPTRKIREGETIEKCVICLSEMEPDTEVRMLPCAHFFHSECIDQWLSHNKCCPIDKKDVTEDS